MKKQLAFLMMLLVWSAQPGLGWMLFDADDPPDSNLTGNSFVDIVYQDYTVWLASGRGLSKTEDFSETWVTYLAASGLVSDEPSAIYARPGQIWAAGSHTEPYGSINYPFGDGFNVSFDNGLTWETSIPDDSAGASFAQLAYDLTGTAISVYAAVFHGGLIVTHDLGDSWEHMYFSPADSNDWVADNWADLTTGRYYACVADTLHADTTIVWGGTAAGIHKFYYLPKRVKMGGNSIYDIVGEDTLVYLAHERGVTRADSSFSEWLTADTVNGLGSNLIRHLELFAGRLWAAAFDSASGDGLGLYVSDDMAESWFKVDTDVFDGPGAGVFDMKIFGDSIIYVAAGDSGVYRSLDTGLTWQQLFVDSTDLDLYSARNQAYSIDATADSLYLGTKAGLVVASYLDHSSFDYDTLIEFPEHDSSGSFVSLVRHFNDDSISFTWVGLEPQTANGNYAAWYLDSLGSLVSIYSQTGTRIYDFAVTDSITIIATSSGLFGSRNKHILPEFVFGVADDNTGLTLVSYPFLTADMIEDRYYTGSTGGFGYYRSVTNWAVFQANTDSLKHDLAVARTHKNSGLPGNWVVALDLQVYGSDTLIWAACRGVSDTTDTIDQVNAVAFSSDFGDSWQYGLEGLQIWNFAFDEYGTAYAAASEGLYSAPPPWDEWTRADIIDPVTQDTIADITEIYSVEVVDEPGGAYLWGGTALGWAKREIATESDWEIKRIFKPTESADDVFASPVPFSPINCSGRLSIHYRVETSANITIKIYDFAMNLVAVPAENKPRDGGADYFETWDGYNQAGDMVATGMYFFKITYSTGEERWGRLAIVP